MNKECILNVQLPPELFQKLRDAATLNCISISAELRLILVAYFREIDRSGNQPTWGLV